MSREPMNAGTNNTGNTVEIEKSNANLAENEAPMTLEQVRAELKGTAGKRFWRSLDELQNTPEFQAAVEKETGQEAGQVGTKESAEHTASYLPASSPSNTFAMPASSLHSILRFS